MLNIKCKHADSLYAFEPKHKYNNNACHRIKEMRRRWFKQGRKKALLQINNSFSWDCQPKITYSVHTHTLTHSHNESCELKKVIQDIKTDKKTRKSLINRIFFNELTSMYYITNNGKSQSPSNVRFDTDNQFSISNLLNRISNHLYRLKQAIGALNSLKMLITFQALTVFWKTISRSNECEMLKLFMN